MDELQPYLTVALLLLLLALGWLLSVRSGRAEAQRMHGLIDDLRTGRMRGFAVILFVVVMIVLTGMCSSK